MAQTEHLGLHQWEAEDSFLRTDFNEDFAKIDAAVVVGTYQGSATGSSQTLKQTISLGFTPRAVFVRNTDDTGNIDYRLRRDFAMAGPDFPAHGRVQIILEVVEGGFRVGGESQMLNRNTEPYLYLAFR